MSSKEFCRPDPEELLRQITAQEANEARGRLKIFLGYASRVGKSLRMFDEGRRRKKRGQDVVIAAIQSRGRNAVASIIDEFEVIPPLRIGEAETIDVDAVLRRAPQVCLVDELARDYPVGSPWPHRWQEVEAIRAHGVNVVAAINLQHIAEQQDAVERITGRRSDSSVPQSFIQSADEIVIVDVPAEELKQHGGTSTLTSGQLSELRELALLLAAQVVEQQLQQYMEAHGIVQSWGTQERILVCITPRSSAHEMLESGARAAERFHGQLLAVYVKQGELPRAAEEAVNDNLDFARKLGAEVHIIENPTGSNDSIDEIIRFAREQRITQLFIGHTQQSTWKFWTRNPVDKLIREAEGMDVRLFPNAGPQAA
jgi:two-component system, OmpR family, sensor histidine kinase KdpD